MTYMTYMIYIVICPSCEKLDASSIPAAAQAEADSVIVSLVPQYFPLLQSQELHS